MSKDGKQNMTETKQSVRSTHTSIEKRIMKMNYVSIKSKFADSAAHVILQFPRQIKNLLW